jgi:hypothetical protein
MRNPGSFANRRADQLEAKKRLAERLRQRSLKQEQRRESGEGISADEKDSGVEEVPSAPWKAVRLADSSFRYYSDDAKTEVYLQPWAKELVNVALESAECGGIHLCLLWPAEIHHLAILHSLANLQRNKAGDLLGLRTLFYPGTHTSRLALQTARVHREELTDLYRSWWTTSLEGTTFHANTRSASYEAVLEALNDIEIWSNPAVDPTLGVLTPCFIHDADLNAWVSSSRHQLESAVRRVNRLANRRDVRDRISPEWADMASAPGALFVAHGGVAKKAWKSVFTASAFQGERRPELILLDATASAAKSNPNAVRRIPEFIQASREHGMGGSGAVVVTDDPRTFFALRIRFSEMRSPFRETVWAAEANQALLTETPRHDGFKPELRSNANCRVAIVDRDAAEVAVKFQRLAMEVGGDDHPGNRLLTEAFLFVLRLSNMPAGLQDLAAELAEREGDSFSSSRFSWSSVVVGLRAATESGLLSSKRLQVERIIDCAQTLISAWNDSTPIAEKLLADVLAHARGKSSLSLVLPNRSTIFLARRFLARRIGGAWSEIDARLEWHSLSNFNFGVGDDRNRHYIVVGFNQHVMRLLLTNPGLPHGTSLLLPYKQADGALKTLRGMKEVAAFTPYRGRIGLLIQELEKRLKELPSLPELLKGGEFIASFDFREGAKTANAGEQSCHRFDLDGGGRILASGWVYRYDIEDGPVFRRTAARDIVIGDLVFDMSEDLRSKLEDSLQVTGSWTGGANYPERQLLKLYHDDVQARCAQLFPGATNRASLARQILEKMSSLSAEADGCRAERIQYWLDLGDQSDLRPHAPKEAKFFRLFCQALGIGAEQTEVNWAYVRSARRLSQDLGRELALRYAEILFHPESAIAYRKVPASEIAKLQHEAVSSVFRVVQITPPENKMDSGS